jgi:hypothetical protein
MFGGAAFGEFAFGEHDSVEADDSAFQAFLEKVRSPRCWLLEIDAQSLAVSDAISAGFGVAAFSEAAFSGDDAGSVGGAETLRYSTHGYTTHGTDSPASTFYAGRMTGEFTVERAIIGRDGIGGLSKVFSEIVLLNTDGGLDALLRDYSIDGRAVRLLVGEAEAAYETFGTVFSGVVETAGITEKNLRLKCTDGLSKIELPVQENTYAGTGGLEGGEDLAGKPKPLCYGAVRNITPPLVDPANLLYQVHDGEINDVTALRDRGIALTKVSGTPSPGEYQPITATGFVKLGASPDGEITCDVEGDTIDAGYTEHPGTILQRVLSRLLSTSDIDTTAFANLYNSIDVSIGIWIGAEPRLASDVTNEILEAIGAFGGFTRQGIFTIGRVAAASGAPVISLEASEILAVERQPMPESIEPVAWRVQVGWGKNYTLQNDVAELTTDADRTFVSEPVRIVADEDALIKNRHLLARDYGPVPSLYRYESEAQTEAERLLQLWGQRRAQYRVLTYIKGMLADLGSVAEVEYPRHTLLNGASGRVVGQSIRGGRVELRVIV